MKKALAKIALALALGLIVITVLDGFNPLMGFLTSIPSKVFIICTCLSSAIVAGMSLKDE